MKAKEVWNTGTFLTGDVEVFILILEPDYNVVLLSFTGDEDGLVEVNMELDALVPILLQLPLEVQVSLFFLLCVDDDAYLKDLTQSVQVIFWLICLIDNLAVYVSDIVLQSCTNDKVQFIQILGHQLLLKFISLKSPACLVALPKRHCHVELDCDITSECNRVDPRDWSVRYEFNLFHPKLLWLLPFSVGVQYQSYLALVMHLATMGQRESNSVTA